MKFLAITAYFMATSIDIGTTWSQVIWKKEERESEKRNPEMQCDGCSCWLLKFKMATVPPIVMKQRFEDDDFHSGFVWTENLLVSSMVWKGSVAMVTFYPENQIRDLYHWSNLCDKIHQAYTTLWQWPKGWQLWTEEKRHRTGPPNRFKKNKLCD